MSSVQNLSHKINIFFLDYLNDHLRLLDYVKLPGYVKRKDRKRKAKSDIQQAQKNVLNSCDTLGVETARDNHKVNIADLVTTVGSAFSVAVDLMVAAEMEGCLEKISGEDCDTSLRCLTDLALESTGLCRLMVKQGVVCALLRVVKDAAVEGRRILGLRALGCVCCVVEGIRELVVMDGIDMIVDTLGDDQNTEDERREAVGVLAQVTSPWIEGNTCVDGVEGHAGNILYSIKGRYSMI